LENSGCTMPISIEDNVDLLLDRLKRKGLSTPLSELYAKGVGGKFCLARHCIDMLAYIEHLDKSEIQVVSSLSMIQMTCNFSTYNQVLFYCESFWNILRSSIDILAQLVNELRSLGINERDVYFGNVNTRVQSNLPNSPLQKAMRSLARSMVFRELNGYRRCVTHRRQVYVHKIRHAISSSGTEGYNYIDLSGEYTTVDRFLCRNPWDIDPIVDSSRHVAGFNSKMLQKIEKRMNTIIKRLP